MLVSLIRRLGVKLSLNDPRWGHRPEGDNKKQEGKKPGEGPPDLDQMWRDFNLRLNRMFASSHRILTLSLALAGRVQQSREAAAELLRMEPGLTVERFRARYPGNRSAHVESFCEGLQIAGIPRA